MPYTLTCTFAAWLLCGLIGGYIIGRIESAVLRKDKPHGAERQT